MDIRIKNYADSKNLKELKYIFVDALDVDPTFVRYEEEYNYCKSIPGLLEPHMELTPFRQDKSRWDEAYWTSLKMDLIKNFSDRRMMHMKEVAQVLLAEKVARILAERSAATASIAPTAAPSATETKPKPGVTATSKTPTISKEEQQRRDLEKEKRKLEEDNRRVQAERQANITYVEQHRNIHQTTVPNRVAGDSSKKAIGIAIVVLAVAAVILVLVLK